jgi:DNA-binding NarL/FixJ family response regulator
MLKAHQTYVPQTASVRPLGARILVVDDSAVMRRSLRSLLESQDHWKVCDEAADGQEAVAKFSRGKFDAIVIDFQMPVMDGLAAAKLITSHAPDTPILMVSMHASSHLEAEARKAGIRGLCGKEDIRCVVEGLATILDNKTYFQN